jgi:hypothetical protein
MKNITQKSKQLHSAIVDWLLFKGPELFITIYGK